jgi:hypothetical protein
VSPLPHLAHPKIACGTLLYDDDDNGTWSPAASFASWTSRFMHPYEECGSLEECILPEDDLRQAAPRARLITVLRVLRKE